MADETAERYRSLFDHALNGLAYCKVLLDEPAPHDFVYLEVNDAFERLLGLGDVVGKRVSEVIPGIREQDGALLARYAEVATTGKPQRFDIHVTSLDTWFSVSVHRPKPGYFLAAFEVTTERRLAAAVQEGEERYRTLTTELQVGVLIQGPSAEILLSNPKALELLGLTEDQLLGRTSFDPTWNVIHDDGAPFPGPTHPVPRAIATRAAVRDVVMGVYRPVSRDRVWLQVNALPQLRPDGSIRQVVCTFADITELRRGQEVLREAERRYRTLFENLREDVSLFRVVRDAEGRPADWVLLEANAQGRQYFGDHYAAAVGKPISALVGAAQAGAFVARSEAVLAGEIEVKEVELRSNGRAYRSTLFALGPDTLVAAAIDITERRRAEDELRRVTREQESILASANVGIVMVVDLVQVWVNQGMEELLGYTRSELLGQPTRMHYPSAAAYDAVLRVMQQTVGVGLPLRTELELRRKDGSLVWVDFNARPVDPSDLSKGLIVVLSDRTALRHAEEALRASEARFRTLFESHSAVMLLVDPADRTLVDANPAAARFYGYDREVLRGMSVQRFNPRSPEEIAESKAESVAAKAFVFQHRMADGTPRTVEVYSSPVEVDGRPLLFGVVQDISERVRAEATLRDNEQRLALAMDQARLATWEVDYATGLFTFNDRFYALYATTAEREGGYQMTAEVYAREFLPPAATPIVAEVTAELVASPDDEATRVHPIVRRDGVARDIVVRIQAIRDDTGRVVGARGTNQDITERVQAEAALRESEARFRAMADSAPVLIWVAGTDKLCSWFNKRWLEFTGRTMSQEAGDGWAEGVHPDDLQQRMVTYVDHFDRRAPFEMDYRLRRHDGEYRWLAVAGVPRTDEAGHFAGYIGSCTDITERKAASAVLEARVAQAVADLRAKDRVLISQSRQAAMGEMIGNIAHQWRQPLNALGIILSNLTDAARFGELDVQEVDRSVAQSKLLIQSMSRTINDFRDFFREVKERVPFSALAQIKETFALLDASFRHANIELAIEPGPDVELVGFPNEYSQVLLNLLSNAKEAIAEKHVDRGKVTVRLSVRDGMGCLTVRDNGGGIPEDLLEKIFEPYFSTKQSGTGIGLYMSRQIVQHSLGGSIVARNVDGGAELDVLTPLASAAA